MYQQNENPNIRQQLKLLSDSRGLKRQSMLKPSNVDRIEGISNGGMKRGGKIYHSRKYKMIPTLYGEGRKIKKMEGGMDRPRRDTPPPQRPNTPEEPEEQQPPRRGRPKKAVVKEEKPPRGKGKLKGGMEAESDSSSDEELKSKSKRLNLKKKSDLEIKNLISRLEIFKDKNQSYVNLGGKWLPVDEQFLLDVIKEAKKRKIKISKKYEKLLGKRRTVKRRRPYGLTLDTMPYGEEEAEKRRRRRKNRARVVGEEREYFPEEEDEDEEEEDDDSPAGARGMEEEDDDDEPAGARGSFRPVRSGRGRPKKLKGGMEAESDSSSSSSSDEEYNLKKQSNQGIRNLILRIQLSKDKNRSFKNFGKWKPVDEQFLFDVLKEAKKRKIKISKKYLKLLGDRLSEKRERPYRLTEDFLPYGEQEAEKRRRRRKNRARVVGEEREYFPEEEDEDEEEDDDSPAGARGMEEEEDEPAGARGTGRSGRGKLEITHYEGGAKLFGKSLMKELMKDPKFKLMGRGFFDKLLEGAKEFTRGVALPVKVAGKLIGNVVPPLKMAGKVVEGIDDPKWLKELKGKARGGKRGSPLQIENPNIRGSGFLDNLGYKKDFEKLGRTGVKKIQLLKKTGGKRKTSTWIDFVKKVAKEQNIPYRDALKVASKQYNK